MKTNKQRQAALRKRRKEQNLRRHEYWLSPLEKTQMDENLNLIRNKKAWEIKETKIVLSDDDVEQVSRKIAEHIARCVQTLDYVTESQRVGGKQAYEIRDAYTEWVAQWVKFFLLISQQC